LLLTHFEVKKNFIHNVHWWGANTWRRDDAATDNGCSYTTTFP